MGDDAIAESTIFWSVTNGHLFTITDRILWNTELTYSSDIINFDGSKEITSDMFNLNLSLSYFIENNFILFANAGLNMNRNDPQHTSNVFENGFFRSTTNYKKFDRWNFNIGLTYSIYSIVR